MTDPILGVLQWNALHSQLSSNNVHRDSNGVNFKVVFPRLIDIGGYCNRTNIFGNN